MKILISYLSGIGNTILFIPTLRLLQQQFPDAAIDVLVRHQGSKEILQRINRTRNIYLMNSATHQRLTDRLRFLYKLRRERYDVNLTTFPSNRAEYNLLSFLIGAGKRIATHYQVGHLETLGFLQTDLVETSAISHDVKQNLSLLTRLGIEVSHAEDNLCWDVSDEESKFVQLWLQTAHLRKKDLLIGIHPGCNPGQGNTYKRWPTQYFAELGDRLIEEWGATVLIFGGNDESHLKQEIAARMRRQALIPDPQPLLKTAALIKQCRLFISNDSGLMHTATAMKVPTVGLFGPSDPARNAPYGKGHVVVRSDVDCMPCNKYPHYQYGGSYVRCQYADGQKGRCMQRLSVQKVYDAILQNYAEILQTGAHRLHSSSR